MKVNPALRSANINPRSAGQFFPDLKREVEKLANNGVKVYVAGLDANFVNHPSSEAFEEMARLLPRAEIIEKKLAVCTFCHQNAGFFFKRNPDLGNGFSDLIGGAEKYAATCRNCYEERKDAIASGALSREVLDALGSDSGFNTMPDLEDDDEPMSGESSLLGQTEGPGTGSRASEPSEKGDLGNYGESGEMDLGHSGLSRQQSLQFVEPSEIKETEGSDVTSQAFSSLPRHKTSSPILKYVPGITENLESGRTESQGRAL